MLCWVVLGAVLDRHRNTRDLLMMIGIIIIMYGEVKWRMRELMGWEMRGEEWMSGR